MSIQSAQPTSDSVQDLQWSETSVATHASAHSQPSNGYVAPILHNMQCNCKYCFMTVDLQSQVYIFISNHTPLYCHKYIVAF